MYMIIYMRCWKGFIMIKIKYVIRIFNPRKEFFVLAIGYSWLNMGLLRKSCELNDLPNSFQLCLFKFNGFLGHLI